MEKYKCIIIDDETYAIEHLTKYIDLIPDLYLIKYFTEPLKALSYLIESESVDLILMDVNMPGISGIELAREIRGKTNKLIFITAHTKYGFEAFEVNADAYLLKPFSLSKFASTIARLFPPLRKDNSTVRQEDFFFVKNKDDGLKIVKVRYNDIVTVESKLNYIQIHTLKKKILTYMSLTEIAKILTKFESFVQFQRSFIINKNFIEYIDGNTIRMTTGIEVTVGDYYRKEFSNFLNEKLIKTGRNK